MIALNGNVPEEIIMALPVEVQIAATGAGRPAVFEVHDLDGHWLHTHVGLEVSDSRRTRTSPLPL